MNMENLPFDKPQNIMQAYRVAHQQIKLNGDSDSKIKAFDKVINFCSNTLSCRLDQSVKKKMLLFWAYNHVADAYLNKDQPEAALRYLERGVRFARSSREKISILDKISEVYQNLGDRLKWLDAREQIIENLSGESRRKEYLKLAEETEDENKVVDLLEKALLAVDEENISLAEKCRNILAICQRLLIIYELRHDEQNWQRIKDLEEDTGLVCLKAR